MRKSVIWMIGFLLLALPGTALCEGWTGDINAIGGVKVMSSDWASVDKQSEGGLMIDLKYGDGPWSFVTYMTYSSDSGDMPASLELSRFDSRFMTAYIDQIMDVDANTQEICIGLLYKWDLNLMDMDLFKLYAGGGLGAVRVHLEGTGSMSGNSQIKEWDAFGNPLFDDYSVNYKMQDNDVGVGPWVSAGAYVQLMEHINVGIDIRGIKADVKLFEDSASEPIEMKAYGFHYTIFAGYHW